MEQKQIALGLKRVTTQEDRITDAYKNEAMDLSRYKAEMDQLAGRRKQLEATRHETQNRARHDFSSRRTLQQLGNFCDLVSIGLEVMTFEERQQLLRLVVEQITVLDELVTVETVIPTEPDGKLRNTSGEPVEP